MRLRVLVLIDTWWNVNLDIAKFEEKCKTVLIDTWWNVNILRVSYSDTREFGFNRYMVECECVTRTDKQLRIWVLIDTWWNVNV